MMSFAETVEPIGQSANGVWSVRNAEEGRWRWPAPSVMGPVDGVLCAPSSILRIPIEPTGSGRAGICVSVHRAMIVSKHDFVPTVARGHSRACCWSIIENCSLETREEHEGKWAWTQGGVISRHIHLFARHSQLDVYLHRPQQLGGGGTACLPGGGRDAYGARGGRGEYHHLCGF